MTNVGNVNLNNMNNMQQQPNLFNPGFNNMGMGMNFAMNNQPNMMMNNSMLFNMNNQMNQMNMPNMFVNNNMNMNMGMMNFMNQMNQMNQVNGMNGFNMMNNGMNMPFQNFPNNMNFQNNMNFPNNFQNNFQNNANANNNFNINNNNDQEIKSILPRDRDIGFNENLSLDQNMKNIKFDASTGIRVLVKVSIDSTIEQALKEFVKKINLPESVIGKDLIFLFNGSQLDCNSKQLVGTLPDMAAITVFDQNNVIGAKKYNK